MTIRIRPARPEDAAVAARILTTSITELCRADHQNDPAAVANWIANKTPDTLAAWIAGGGIRIAEADGTPAAVGALDPAAGTITLNYVDPAYRRRGLSAALLAAMETELAAAGIATARLTSTATARDFYLHHGWRSAGPGRTGRWILGYPLEKRLNP
ncbi:GNAT family N-acetyltransferase [Pseudodonghicola flavimaris]|uniref:GNAT family N-acetyltransferase n=1 Tax=Pseudodonghicola flavimaris TaxID=3050036 RepID=A0ABT7F3X3_9RHOB|nr:GNAT family N-acetyltransferase [Pseudodonghicola flavimaris]MDK3019190.1 GNAT family N-acetyltransferase [Pseudodonghicola flavimaris]